MGLVLLEVLAEEWDFSYATDLRTILPCREGRVLSHRVYRFWRDAHGAVREEGTSAQPSGSEESTLAIHRVADFASDHSYFPGWSYQNHQYTSEEIKVTKDEETRPGTEGLQQRAVPTGSSFSFHILCLISPALLRWVSQVMFLSHKTLPPFRALREHIILCKY